MAKIIYVCAKRTLPDSVACRLRDICNHLAPDNITPPAPKIVVNDSTAYGIMNPGGSILESGNSVLIGHLYEDNARWAEPTLDPLDGSYVLFRDHNEAIELVCDPVGSRTIWYYLNDDLLVSSTSQRAIIMFVGSFEFDERVVPWILSSGSTGPSFSWDKRIRQVPPDSTVRLNKKDWSISTKSTPIEFQVLDQTETQQEQLVKDALETTFTFLTLDLSRWALPLSGGYDSRAILCLLRNTFKDIGHLRTVTWGLESSLYEKDNDAYVAKEVANALDVSHTYYHTDLSDEPLDTIFNRFFLLGEGRIEHVSGYMDGFEIWKTLFEEGVEGTIRGDEGFGHFTVTSPPSVRFEVGCSLCSDFANLADYESYGIATQEVPQRLLQREGETLDGWRDRLYHDFRFSTVHSALSDLKLSYVESISPFLSRKILSAVRHLPDQLRTQKKLFRRIAMSMSPNIALAQKSAIASRKNIFRQERITTLLEKELSSTSAKSIFSPGFLSYISRGITTEGRTRPTTPGASSLRGSLKRVLKTALRRAVPRKLRTAIRKRASLPSVDNNVLAFRVFLISRMNTILNEDAKRARIDAACTSDS